MQMIIVHARPPIWELAQKAFHFKDDAKLVFTWGNIIYAPNVEAIPLDVIHHEKTHEKQQAKMGGPEKWWAKYLADPAFRAGQEAEAYGAQYSYFCDNRKDREMRFKCLNYLCHDLTTVYGFSMTMEDARHAILNKAKKYDNESRAISKESKRA